METAGRSDHQSSQMELIGIEDAYLFIDKVLEQREVLINSRNAKGDADVLSEIRDTS